MRGNNCSAELVVGVAETRESVFKIHAKAHPQIYASACCQVSPTETGMRHLATLV